MSTQSRPEDSLHLAEQLMTDSTRGSRSVWPRAAAWLIRLALERGLDEYWALVLPEAADCPMRAQLILLTEYCPAPTASLIRQSWNGLSGACHHHAYELAPTSAELRSWHIAVSACLRALAVNS